MGTIASQWSMRRAFLFIAAALAAVTLFAACSTDDNDTDLGSVLSGLDNSQIEALARGVGTISIGGNAAGIQARGTGAVKVDPDIATMSLGVEAIAATVSDARQEAAVAITSMIDALKANGVDEDDIETRYFNIRPEYTYDQVAKTLENGERITTSERRLIGYRVTNTLAVTIRDIDNVGTVIDATVEAGGDVTRLDSISFSIEDGAAAEEEARKLAIADALAKADLYAEETGVDRGKLLSIVETSGDLFANQARAEAAFLGADLAYAPTPIIAGDLEVRVTVQTVFDID